MGSKKPSARAKQRAAFESNIGDLSSLFEREERHREQVAAEREEAKRRKACSSKNRYVTRAEAEEAVASCADCGRTGLHVYRCPYCNGWHLTSHPQQTD